MSPLLVASALRVDLAGEPAIDGLTFESTGKVLLLLGAPRALFMASAGILAAEHGTLLIDGITPRAAARTGIASAAALDPPMPARWTVRQYVGWSARLSGLSASHSHRAAASAIGRLQLQAFADSRLGLAPLMVRRATAVAAAIATEAPVILLDDPIIDLPDPTARAFATVVTRAVADRRVVFFAGRIALDSPIALGADEAIVVRGSQKVVQGPPAELRGRERTFVVRATGEVAAFMDAVTGGGGRLLGSATSGGAARFTVELGALRTGDILRLAEACGSVVLELRPIAGVFA